MKTLLFILLILIEPLTGRASAAEELTEGGVAQRILKAEGYRMFRFEPAKVQSHRLIVKEGKNTAILHLPASERYVVTVQLAKNNNLRFVRVDTSSSEMVSMTDPTRVPGNFSLVTSQAVVVENEPFLTLSGADGEVQLVIVP